MCVPLCLSRPCRRVRWCWSLVCRFCRCGASYASSRIVTRRRATPPHLREDDACADASLSSCTPASPWRDADAATRLLLPLRLGQRSTHAACRWPSLLCRCGVVVFCHCGMDALVCGVAVWCATVAWMCLSLWRCCVLFRCVVWLCLSLPRP